MLSNDVININSIAGKPVFYICGVYQRVGLGWVGLESDFAGYFMGWAV